MSASQWGDSGRNSEFGVRNVGYDLALTLRSLSLQRLHFSSVQEEVNNVYLIFKGGCEPQAEPEWYWFSLLVIPGFEGKQCVGGRSPQNYWRGTSVESLPDWCPWTRELSMWKENSLACIDPAPHRILPSEAQGAGIFPSNSSCCVLLRFLREQGECVPSMGLPHDRFLEIAACCRDSDHFTKPGST